MPDKKKKLIPGETSIGSFSIKDKATGNPVTYTVYFGNAVLPRINGQLRHLPEESYKAMLVSFFQKGGADDYEAPSDEEIKAAAEKVNSDEVARIKAELAKKAEEEARKKAEEEARRRKEAEEAERARIEKEQREKAEAEAKRKAEEEARIMAEVKARMEAEKAAEEERKRKEEEERRIQEMMQKMKDDKAVTPEKAPEPQIQEEEDDDDEEDDEEYDEEPRRKNSVLSILLKVFMVLSLIGIDAYVVMNVRNKMAAAPQKEQTVQLDIDGKTYEVKLNYADLAEGQTKITLYGIVTSNQDGSVKTSLVPMGVLDLKDIKFADSNASASPDASAVPTATPEGK